ncbi:auxin response factor 4-like isoform X1 [Dioscorea cayenensis subsp. rotundata]|uniref:Auxin response factor n=2 Tax=Dioscorea cayennensis subsp. rotundata TaxID=55577 RepID=A0AB40AJM8_DIOCR|nr:auxin response factor 4-like isoform X1 [Dioscorea cayenensis subsp. rotundata]
MARKCREERKGVMEGGNSSNQDGNDIHTENWRLCAGPNVSIPSAGDRVFYFPQGHIEQVEAYANQDSNRPMPSHGLPSKILCRVVNVQLKAERDTDEVFAQVSLVPEHEQQENTAVFATQEPTGLNPRVYSFCKILTASDTSTHGGFSILKRHAEKCLPPLDMSQQPPVQTLVAKDLHDVEWTFRHIYRGQPKRHLLTTGWSTFVCAKKLVAGDAFIFLRDENGELRVGVRRAMKKPGNSSASVISGQSMRLGVLASASHAITSGAMFTLYYWPRRSPEFLIPYDRYMESVKIEYPIGMRFQMKFEGDEGQEERLTGTIVGKEDSEPMSWLDSQWRCLKIQWDGTLTAMHPERISPWQIIPFTSADVHPLVNSRSKRVRNAYYRTPPQGPLNAPVYPIPRYSGVLQGQENMAQGQRSGCVIVEQPNLRELSTPGYLPPHTNKAEGNHNVVDYTKPMELENLSFPLRPKFSAAETSYRNPGSKTFDNPSLDSYWHFDKQNAERSLNETNAGTINNSGKQSMCKIFGVLIKGSTSTMSPNIVTSVPPQDVAPVAQPKVATYDIDQLSEPSKSTRPTESGCSASLNEQSSSAQLFQARSCTKVHKQGSALGRSVDLSRFEGYEELKKELDRMFEFNGALIDQSKGWKIIYTDDEGDIMMLGDYPWHAFCSMVRRIYIYTQEEVEKLKPGMLNG